jgi:hypothetical protein
MAKKISAHLIQWHNGSAVVLRNQLKQRRGRMYLIVGNRHAHLTHVRARLYSVLEALEP